MWLKIDNLKPLTIHLLLRYTEGIAFDLQKLEKASKICGDLRRSPEIVVSLRTYSDGLRECSEVFGQPLEAFGSVRAIFGNLQKVSCGLREASYGLRKSSEGFARSSAVFEIHRLASSSLRFNFGYLPCNLHSCFTFLHCVTLFCTVLTKNALLFSQSEPSNFFKCIINGGTEN